MNYATFAEAVADGWTVTLYDNAGTKGSFNPATGESVGQTTRIRVAGYVVPAVKL
jgi:hypothetical protein